MNIQEFTDYSYYLKTYSIEKINSDTFRLLGFEDFFTYHYGKQSLAYNKFVKGASFASKKFNLIKEALYSDNSLSNSMTLYRSIRTMDLSEIFSNYNVKQFTSVTNLIFEQWEQEANRYGLNIQDEKSKFLDIQKNGINKIKDVLNHKKIIDIFMFKLKNSFSKENSSKTNEDNLIKLITYVDEHSHQFSFESLVDMLKTGGHGLLDLKDDLNDVVLSIVDKIRNASPHAYESFAENYCQAINNAKGNIKDFFVSKLEMAFLSDIELTKGQHFQRAVAFCDSSVLFVDRDGQYQIPKNATELLRNLDILYKDIIDFKCRKYPTFSKIFQQKLAEDGKIQKIVDTIDVFLSNYTILKLSKFDPSILNQSLEVIDDAIHSSVKTFKVNKYAASILSSKYKDLLTPAVYPFFEKFYDEKLQEDFLQTYIGKKLAAIKTPEDFLTFVKKVHDNFFLFSKDYINLKLNQIEKTPIYEDASMIIVEVDNFKESQHLGTSNWCISREQHYYDDYKSTSNRQYFVYDFTKAAEDTKSMIGITITYDGRVHAAHEKNDSSIKHTDLVDDISSKIICAQYNDYKDELSYNDQIKFEKILGINQADNPAPVPTRQNNNNMMSI